jgi:uncharacterized protein
MTGGGSPAAIAVAVTEMARDGRFADVEDLFAAPLRAVVSADALRAGWAALTGSKGPVRAIGEPTAEPAGAGLVRVRVPVTCEHGGLTVIMSVDGAGRLQGLLIEPAIAGSWTPPGYAAPDRFTEREVRVGSGPLAVSGTLSVPYGDGPWPGVVLLSGGGPFDRDQTSGPNKPLKDLAWGLASSGAAVVRFDKVTCAHPGQVADFTLADEYVPHAVAAVRLLLNHPAVDPARVFVAGHSAGGKAAPRVAAAEPAVAGLVILAGDTQPMHQAAIRVARYLAALDPGPATQAFAETITRQAALAGSPDLSRATPASELPFGLPASYWLDLRDYDPVATAAALDKRMLILQGGRDFQVTAEDDLSGWQAGLGHRADVTIRVHGADNHLFFPGTGPSTPAEYETPQHVDPAVVAEIARWLTPGEAAGADGNAVALQAALDGDVASFCGLDQGGVVGLGLVGVEPGEPGEGDVEAVGRADVADDHRRPAGAGVTLGQQMPDDRGVVCQRGTVDGVQRHGPLHVPELADVVLVVVEGGPPEQRIADRLQRLLVLHHALALMGVPGRLTVNVGGQDRPSRLFQLQEQHVVGAAAFEQGDVGAQPDAADADHLVGDVDDRVAAEHPSPVRGQGGEVLVESLGDRVRLGVAEPREQRRVFH